MNRMVRLLASILVAVSCATAADPAQFDGKHFRGRGDVEYLQLLDTARRMFEPDPQFENISMFYTPEWNGFVLGPTWNMWWIQNTYGTSYCSLPFLQEPYVTFLANSQRLWFDHMGDGKRAGCPEHPALNWVAPDGQLVDAASPTCAIYKQGDGKTEIHDWGVEFTAAGVVMQAESLLIARDRASIARDLPLLERSLNFLDTRRDPNNGLMLAGHSGNLLAPSYAGWHKPDGTLGQAYLAGLSITYIAALDRVIELEKMAGATGKVQLYSTRRDAVRKGLPLLTTEEGYFIKSLDPDGTRHGVYGAAKHGYFEASPNHDAICFRVAHQAQSERIYDKIASIPGLRPHSVIITNYPSLDDTYEEPKGLWEFGRWVNGGHWSTCEARMLMAYARLGKYEDARRSMQHILTFAQRFRMDNNLTNFGADVYQPKQPVNLVYDTWGIPAGLLRGLFEYRYTAKGLTLEPHIPPAVTELEQKDPIRFGTRRVYLATAGAGPIRRVTVNGVSWKQFTDTTVDLLEASTPAIAHVAIAFGDAPLPRFRNQAEPEVTGEGAQRWVELVRQLKQAGLGNTYAAAHAQLVVQSAAAIRVRQNLLASGKLERLPEPSQQAADDLYVQTMRKLSAGLERYLAGLATSRDPSEQNIYRISKQIGLAKTTTN